MAEARKCAGMIQWKAANALGISENALSRFERGVRPVPVDVIVRAARVYEAPELVRADPVLSEAIDIWQQAA